MQIPGMPAPQATGLLQALSGFAPAEVKGAAPTETPRAVKRAGLPAEERLLAGLEAGAKGAPKPRGSFVDFKT